MYAKNINKETVLELTGRGAMLVDMRSPVEFRNGSISGAINLPLKNFLNTITGLKKSTKLIIFGNSEDDSEIKAGINYAAQLGFNNIFVSNFNSLK